MLFKDLRGIFGVQMRKSQLPVCQGEKIRLSTDNTLYIHGGYDSSIICKKRNHDVKLATAIVEGIDGKSYELCVKHCLDCDKFYISDTAYKLYIGELGFILARLEMCDDIELNKERNDFNFDFEDTSPLSLMGYTVRQNSRIPDAVRQSFLAMVMDKGLLDKSTILHYLEQFLNVNAKKAGNEKAKEKWSDDLIFVLEYKKGEQQSARINEIADWSGKRRKYIVPYYGGVDRDNTLNPNITATKSTEKGLRDEKQGDVKIVIRQGERLVQMFINNYITSEARNYLFAHGWVWNRLLKCWERSDRDNAYETAWLFLAGDL